MSGIHQAVVSTFVDPLPIGSAYQGGYYAGEISTSGNGVATHRLVVSPKSSGQSQKAWKTTSTSTAGTSSVIDGPTNSSNMNNASHPAAQFCEGLTIGGYSDWYMPAKNELEVLYYNLKPTTDSNDTSSGANTNAVPSRASNYSSGTPAQTSATDFKTGGGQEITATDGFLSSTEAGAAVAWGQFFSFVKSTTSGTQANNIGKTNSDFSVRAVRRVAI